MSSPPASTAAVRPMHLPCTQGTRAHHCVLQAPLGQHALEVLQNARVALPTESAKDEAPARRALGSLDGPPPHFPHALVVVLLPREHPAIGVIPGIGSSSVCHGAVGGCGGRSGWQCVHWHHADWLKWGAGEYRLQSACLGTSQQDGTRSSGRPLLLLASAACPKPNPISLVCWLASSVKL